MFPWKVAFENVIVPDAVRLLTLDIDPEFIFTPFIVPVVAAVIVPVVVRFPVIPVLLIIEISPVVPPPKVNV